MKTIHFQNSEIKNSMDSALNALSNHTDRDTALIAAELINESLGQLLKKIVPTDFTASQLFEYPAPLSNLPARADAAVAFRLICQHIHKAAKIIIRVRALASRSNNSFSLSDHAPQLEQACIELIQPWRNLTSRDTSLVSDHIFSWFNTNHYFQPDEQGQYRTAQSKELIEEIIDNLHICDDEYFARWCLISSVCIIRGFLEAGKNELASGLNDTTLLSHAFRSHPSEHPSMNCPVH